MERELPLAEGLSSKRLDVRDVGSIQVVTGNGVADSWETRGTWQRKMDIDGPFECRLPSLISPLFPSLDKGTPSAHRSVEWLKLQIHRSIGSGVNTARAFGILMTSPWLVGVRKLWANFREERGGCRILLSAHTASQHNSLTIGNSG